MGFPREGTVCIELIIFSLFNHFIVTIYFVLIP